MLVQLSSLAALDSAAVVTAALYPAKGCSCVKVQSRPGVTLHCEHVPRLHPLQAGETGCELTAVTTPIGVVNMVSVAAKIR